MRDYEDNVSLRFEYAPPSRFSAPAPGAIAAMDGFDASDGSVGTAGKRGKAPRGVMFAGERSASSIASETTASDDGSEYEQRRR